MQAPTYTRVSSSTSPRYAACDRCGRNKHKVAVRFATPYVQANELVRVGGYCPSCITRETVIMWARRGDKVLYDVRGDRARNAMPLELTIDETLELAERDTSGARVTWARCGHPAELDATCRCYTCGGSVL